ncbi:hypothetical protein CK203_090539 [Vitis vinifera]|uniref:DUF4283 domain-containing protein n=1 Tax=Vitis vinifera TaxID=29760 RepID=A0A438F2D7_VITVI|nr:hypothetical protein CK203_090539 [Vitis vinifera]
MAGRQYAHPFDTSIKEFVRHLSNLSFHHNINYISIILCIRKCVQDMGETNVSVILCTTHIWTPSALKFLWMCLGRKLKGIIVEWSRGFTSWIRFGSLSLCCLLEGVEACCKGILGGWVLLAEKLRSLGVSTRDEPREVFVFSRTESKVGASEGKVKNSYVNAVKTRARRLGEVVWLQLEEKDVLSGRELLDRCLVGRWEETPMSTPDLSALGSCGRSHWNLKREVKVARMGFENEVEADKVLLRGLLCFKESFLHLKMWDPKVGCSQNVDEDTVAFKELQWARLLVKSEGLEWPSSLQVAVGSSYYAIQLWWEVQTHEQFAKVVVSCEVGEGNCRKDRETALSDFVSAKGAKDERTRRGSFCIQLGSFPPTLNFIEITDEALMEEAFRYTNYYPCSLFSFGKWDFSSSSTLSGRDGVIIATDGGSERGYGSKEVGGADLGPLRVILVDGREAEVCDLPIRANGDVDEVKEVGSERVFQEVVEEMD